STRSASTPRRWAGVAAETEAQRGRRPPAHHLGVDSLPQNSRQATGGHTMSRMAMALGIAGFLVHAATRADEKSVKMPPMLKAAKTHLVNDKNERVRLRGVNAASLEWTSDGEGHILETVNVAIREWRVNIIRLPLSQDRWFGKAPEQKDSGQAYRELVNKVVGACASQGCYVMLDLHWSDAGEWGKNIAQHVMPDHNSLAFWKDVAAAYKDHPAVLFDLYNEPHDVSWDVWLKGGIVTERNRRAGTEMTLEAVGMQELLDAVRETGAKNVVVAGGINWAYDLSGIVDGKRLADPKGNGVVYACHYYPNKDPIDKWVEKIKVAQKQFPVIIGEFGTEPLGPQAPGRRAEGWVRDALAALDDPDWDWIAWDMHPQAGPRLVSDWKYTPTPTFGVYVKAALAGKHPMPEKSPPPKPVANKFGIFDDHADVGTVLHPGSAKYDEANKSYTITGSGENMWAAKDAFQFAWRKAEGDLAIVADIAFVGAGKNPHRKACLLFRHRPCAAHAIAALALA